MENVEDSKSVLNKWYKRILRYRFLGKPLVANFNEKNVTRRLESFK